MEFIIAFFHPGDLSLGALILAILVLVLPILLIGGALTWIIIWWSYRKDK